MRWAGSPPAPVRPGPPRYRPLIPTPDPGNPDASAEDSNEIYECFTLALAHCEVSVELPAVVDIIDAIQSRLDLPQDVVDKFTACAGKSGFELLKCIAKILIGHVGKEKLAAAGIPTSITGLAMWLLNELWDLFSATVDMQSFCEKRDCICESVTACEGYCTSWDICCVNTIWKYCTNPAEEDFFTKLTRDCESLKQEF